MEWQSRQRPTNGVCNVHAQAYAPSTWQPSTCHGLHCPSAKPVCAGTAGVVLPLGITLSMLANIDAAFTGKQGRKEAWALKGGQAAAPAVPARCRRVLPLLAHWLLCALPLSSLCFYALQCRRGRASRPA